MGPVRQDVLSRGRVLYFDIDGVLLDYDDRPKVALVQGRLQQLLETAGFGRLVCVSGWCDVVRQPALRIPVSERLLAVHRIIAPLFPDGDWFLNHAEITDDTDHRCRHIDLTSDWFYVDDWADKFFSEQFGVQSYQQELGRRILCCDPRGDGSDIVVWLLGLAQSSAPGNGAFQQGAR